MDKDKPHISLTAASMFGMLFSRTVTFLIGTSAIIYFCGGAILFSFLARLHLGDFFQFVPTNEILYRGIDYLIPLILYGPVAFWFFSVLKVKASASAFAFCHIALILTAALLAYLPDLGLSDLAYSRILISIQMAVAIFVAYEFYDSIYMLGAENLKWNIIHVPKWSVTVMLYFFIIPTFTGFCIADRVIRHNFSADNRLCHVSGAKECWAILLVNGADALVARRADGSMKYRVVSVRDDNWEVRLPL